ncbi:MAG TPA: hypothetical protein DEQ14_05910 [Treponema sp.]|nr:hypothetical protein [Treponema sp.]
MKKASFGAAAKISTSDIAQTYTRNIANTDLTYKDQLLRISASVQEIMQYPSGSDYPRFEGTGSPSKIASLS